MPQGPFAPLGLRPNFPPVISRDRRVFRPPGAVGSAAGSLVGRYRDSRIARRALSEAIGGRAFCREGRQPEY